MREATAPLLALLAALGAVLALGAAPETLRALDAAAVHALHRPAGPSVVREAVRDVTALGSLTVGALVLATVALPLALGGRPRQAVFLVAGVAAGVALAFLLKELFGHPRPAVLHGVHVATPSFPSAHAATAAVLYLALADLAGRTLARRRARVVVWTLAVLVVLAVGASRVYFGVHGPLDVLAGWALGAGWAAALGSTARTLERRGRLEPLR